MVDSSSDDDNILWKKKRALIRCYIFAQRKENGEYNQLVR